MTFDQFIQHIHSLAQKIADSGAVYNCVIAVGRGGMPVASMLANLLDIKICHYIAYGRGIGWLGDSFNNELPDRALVVDDAAESGGSLAALAIQYGAFDSAVLLTRPDCRFPVTYRVFESTDPTDFIMPFEKTGA